MTRSHKHAVAIKAWADGAAVQFAQPVSATHFDPFAQREPDWQDWLHGWPQGAPSWQEDQLWRVKPDSTPVRLRTAAMTNGLPAAKAARLESGGIWTVHVTNDEAARSIEDSADFIRWLHDWVEIERPAPVDAGQSASADSFSITPDDGDFWGNGTSRSARGVSR